MEFRAVLNLLCRDICFYKLFLINENKNTEYLNSDYANVIKFMKIISNSTHNKQKTQKRAERQKRTSFPKESVENADLYKPILNKIMAAHK